MTLNLVQHRGQPSIWDRTTPDDDWDTERWLARRAGWRLFVAGFRRRRSAPGSLIALGGSGLAWWAAPAAMRARVHRGRLQAAMPTSASAGDVVHEAAEESFPASDAPSWTPTTGNTVRGTGSLPSARVKPMAVSCSPS